MSSKSDSVSGEKFEVPLITANNKLVEKMGEASLDTLQSFMKNNLKMGEGGENLISLGNIVKFMAVNLPNEHPYREGMLNKYNEIFRRTFMGLVNTTPAMTAMKEAIEKEDAKKAAAEAAAAAAAAATTAAAAAQQEETTQEIINSFEPVYIPTQLEMNKDFWPHFDAGILLGGRRLRRRRTKKRKSKKKRKRKTKRKRKSKRKSKRKRKRKKKRTRRR